MREMKKPVFITGGASGIGAATVAKFCNEDWNVLLNELRVKL